mgnify:CR=1 FL=1
MLEAGLKKKDRQNKALVDEISATIILPLLHIISGSFSDPMQLLTGNVSFWPKGFTTSMYEKVLKDASIWTGYLNTILYTVLAPDQRDPYRLRRLPPCPARICSGAMSLSAFSSLPCSSTAA